MKKYRLFAAIMAAVLMISVLPMISVQAADTIGKEALACKELGILLGSDESGITTKYLSTIPTRTQAYVIFLRLKGLYDEAGSFKSNNNFKDAALQAWAKNYLAYAKNTPELGWNGYADGRFGVNDKISGQAFYKVLLETLGYRQNIDFTYENTLMFAAKIGLLDSTTEVTLLKSFTTNDIAKGIYRALNTNLKETDKKLVDFLSDKGIFSQQKVEAAGLSSSIQLAANMDLEYGIPMVSVEEVYSKMGCYIIKTTTSNTGYEIRKDAKKLRINNGSVVAYIDNDKYTMERPVMKDKAGVFYVPASFIVTSAKVFGYDAKYSSSSHILSLNASAVTQATEGEIVIVKGGKTSIKVEKRYSDIYAQNITSQCSFTAASTGGIVMMGANPGDIIGNTIGTETIIVKYMGKEVDRVVAHVMDVVPTTYPEARYEQIFSSAFRLDKTAYTDVYGIVWNKKTGVIAMLNESSSVDSGTSLNIKNYASGPAGVTADLTKLLEERAIKGKKLTLKIYAQGVGENSQIIARAYIKTSIASSVEDKIVSLTSNWKNCELLKLEVPDNAKTFALDISAAKGGEINIDGFTITVE